ncbi:MAG: hypothetical protein Ta2B_27060 [Termitinemataceae bacterium]|nr:MAG: hypothetical protein Ta2B_27060 [Termitinemataceae bacterium]
MPIVISVNCMKIRAPLLVIIFLFFSSHLGAKTDLENGIEHYSGGNWGEAIYSFRNALNNSHNNMDKAEAQFWIAVTELSAGQYQDALGDLDETVRIDPNTKRLLEIPYHKARALYYLGRFQEAIPLFRFYSDNINVDTYSPPNTSPSSDYNKKAAAIYWIGECYYSLGELTRAEEIFQTVINFYTKSHKYETSNNRIAMIRQKKIESELLELLRSTKAEQTVESNDYTPNNAQTKKEYDDAMLAYRNTIEPYLLNKAIAENDDHKKYIDGNNGVPTNRDSVRTANDPDTIMRLLAIKTTALEMMDRLVSTLNSYEGVDSRDWTE